MAKTWLGFQDQLDQLRSRGLIIDDDQECFHFLSCVNYYRFSGYFRYWQQAPVQGNNQFIEGARFTTIRDVYLGEQEVTGQAALALRRIELLMRTKFAHHYAQRVAPTGALACGAGMTRPAAVHAPSIGDHILRDLDRSKEAFIGHYRDDTCQNKQGEYLPQAYDSLPVWVAVEALSFGTLSRCIQASDASGVLDDIAQSINVSRTFLASQVRSFVYLRNRIAHHARIWNHSVLDAPGLVRKLRSRAMQSHGRFEYRSVYEVLVALDGMLSSARMEKGWLGSVIDPIIAKDALLANGLKSPRKYGEINLLE